jgi:hypothetical protein
VGPLSLVHHLMCRSASLIWLHLRREVIGRSLESAHLPGVVPHFSDVRQIGGGPGQDVLRLNQLRQLLTNRNPHPKTMRHAPITTQIVSDGYPVRGKDPVVDLVK